MATNDSTVNYKHISGKLSEHFIFLLTADGKVEERDRVYCVHCCKQFAFRGSYTSLTYHLQHKHPLNYQHVVNGNASNGDRQKSFQAQAQSNNSLWCKSNKPVSDKVSANLKLAIAQWIASSGRPTAIVEDDGLQTVLRIALQNRTYNLPSRGTIDNFIDQMYYEKLTEHKKTIERIHSIALTTEFWTSNNNELYCGITGHWIDSDWKLTSLALGCLFVNEQNIAENIANFFEEFAATWGITNKVCCIVIDSSAHNMVAAISKTGYSHIPCIAHCLQLSILAGLKAADSSHLVTKCRHLVGHFKHSLSNTAELKTSHSSSSLPNYDIIFHKLQQDVATRWNSTYTMLARMMEVKDAIIQYHIDHPKNYSGPKLTESDWDNIARYTSVLGSLAEATEYVGSEQYATCSAVIPLEAFLRRLLRVNDDDPDYIAQFKTATLNDFTNRIEGIDAFTTLQMAMALDPRYKKLTSLRQEKREAVWTALSNAFQDFYNSKYPAGHPTGSEEKSNDETKAPVPKKQKLTLLQSDSESHSSADVSDVVQGAQAELMRYKEETSIPETEDPLMWWKLNNHRFPVLSSYVQTILCVPATSVPCERLFNSSGYIVNKMRSSLLPENVNTLVCLHDWLK